MVFPEDGVEPRAVLEFRIELLDDRFGARALRRHIAGRRHERR